MNPAADKLKQEIATAESRLKALEGRTDLQPHQRQQMTFQIKRVQDLLRTMRINLAAMQDHRDIRCPNCRELMPHSFFICRVCMSEVPPALYFRLKGAIGFHHHGLLSAEALTAIKLTVLSHLKQHSSAIA